MYAGAMPFVAGVWLLLISVPTLPLLGNVIEAMAAYGFVITVFLTGIHWGQQLSLGYAASGLFVSSNIIAIIVWLSWLLVPRVTFLLVLAVLFLFLLSIDFVLRRKLLIRQDYFRSRIIITTLVISCLVVAFASS